MSDPIKGVPAKGTTLSVDFGGSGGSEVANVISIDFSGWETGTVEVSNLSSTDREFLATISDGGEISCELNYDPAQHGGFATMKAAGLKRGIVITFPDDSSTTVSCDAILTGFEISVGSVEDVLTASATFKVTGEVTLG